MENSVFIRETTFITVGKGKETAEGDNSMPDNEKRRKRRIKRERRDRTMEFEYFYGKQSSQHAFYRIPKQLFTDRQFDALSVEAKLLYGMMIDRMELSQKNGWIDSQGRAYIYFTVDELKDRLHCANDKAVKLMRELGGG